MNRMLMVVDEAARDLVQACASGNREARRALFETYKDRVYSIALRYSGEPATAADITQDVFVKLFGQIAAFRGESKFESWLYRMVVNRCLDHRRRFSRLAPLAGELAEKILPAVESAADALEREETAEAVQAAVARLSDDLRMVVVLRYTEDLSYEEIADVVGCPPGTVASRLSRAHKELARRLARHGKK